MGCGSGTQGRAGHQIGTQTDVAITGGVVLRQTITHDSFAVARRCLLVFAAQKQSVALLLQLLCGGTLLRAAGHLLHRLRGARLALLPYPVPRLFGWIADRFKNGLSHLLRVRWWGVWGARGKKFKRAAHREKRASCVNFHRTPNDTSQVLVSRGVRAVTEYRGDYTGLECKA